MAALSGDKTSIHLDNLCLHDMFKVVGNQLTQKDVRTLKGTYNLTSADLADENSQAKITDGFSFLLALEKFGVVDESNLKPLIHILSKFISRHDLIQFVTLRRRKAVSPDPVAQFLEETAVPSVLTPTKHKYKRRHHSSGDSTASEGSTTQKESTTIVNCGNNTHPIPDKHFDPQSCATVTSRSCVSSVDEPSPKKRPRIHQDRQDARKLGRRKESSHLVNDLIGVEFEIKKKVTCDIRLRVRAEYCHHDSALDGNVFSNKPDPLERQFEKFMQANTILKSRDLGSIICDIKFSELTYLDAFWRDYINGSLLEALKGVFITESLKQAVGHEAIKLLVNVDEDDYEAGRLKLLENLKE